ncbi:MAG: hypothetical protein U1E62_05400 [Alsobacter sp.]
MARLPDELLAAFLASLASRRKQRSGQSLAWNRSKSSPAASLSVDGRSFLATTLSDPGEFACVRTTIGSASAPIYLEVIIEDLTGGAGSDVGVGFCNSDLDLTTATSFLGESSMEKSAMVWGYANSAYGSASIIDGTGFPPGDLTDPTTFMLALHPALGTAYIGRDGEWLGDGDPAAGTNAWCVWEPDATTWFFAACLKGNNQGVIRIPRTRAYDAPAGYRALQPAASVAFITTDGGDFITTDSGDFIIQG